MATLVFAPVADPTRLDPFSVRPTNAPVSGASTGGDSRLSALRLSRGYSRERAAGIECAREDRDSEWGWAGYLVDLDDDGEDEVAIFCPDYAAREFGKGRPG